MIKRGYKKEYDSAGRLLSKVRVQDADQAEAQFLVEDLDSPLELAIQDAAVLAASPQPEAEQLINAEKETAEQLINAEKETAEQLEFNISLDVQQTAVEPDSSPSFEYAPLHTR